MSFMWGVRQKRVANGIRFGGAAAALAAAVLFVNPQTATANCLYPDKTSGTGPSYACLKPAERMLVELRKFRAEITVAALRCNQRTAYNDVITRHRSELVSEGKALGAVFRRLHGAAGERELNRYVTHLTNRASMRSIGVPDYCGSMARVLDGALNAPVRGFIDFVGRDPIARAEAPRHVVPTSIATTNAPPKK